MWQTEPRLRTQAPVSWTGGVCFDKTSRKMIALPPVRMSRPGGGGVEVDAGIGSPGGKLRPGGGGTGIDGIGSPGGTVHIKGGPGRS